MFHIHPFIIAYVLYHSKLFGLKFASVFIENNKNVMKTYDGSFVESALGTFFPAINSTDTISY